ncbi:MAG: hypothetical protein COA42_21615 [Alteromonadaceae bacterium]|nr:MAG: hypothetical protein COA42_21615 [Alteromonadaceae bacterium]
MMLALPGYHIGQLIYQSSKSLVYRGCRDTDKQTLVFKLLNRDYPSAREISRFRREYELTRSLRLDGVIGIVGIEPFQNSLVMIQEDFNAEPLSQTIATNRLRIEERLSLAIRLTDIIEQVHQHNIMHKNINPSNIIWNPQNGRIKLIDFGIATALSRENPDIHNPNISETTLFYISPEQTGRMNRSMDYRTDLYSLGVTLYELFTGCLPFPIKDPMELVHAHLAKIPRALHEVNTELPPLLSQIVLKLLAKGAEDRYQSAVGLKADLQYCLEFLRTNPSTEATQKFTGEAQQDDDDENEKGFVLATQDLSDTFQPSQKLYGRDNETTQLLNAFEKVSQGNVALMLIEGNAGIGKSSLVHEIYKPIVKKHGYFIEGKADQFSHSIPYASLIQAIQGLIRQLLSEQQEQIKRWKSRLLATLGDNAQVIIDVIPEVEWLLGKQITPIELPAAESNNRFNLMFKRFLCTFATQEHPLVIFLDDLQWTDVHSIRLIEQLLTDVDIGHMFIIGTYRTGESSESHNTSLIKSLVSALPKNKLHQFTLHPLDLQGVNTLIADTLSNTLEHTRPLAQLCLEKTQGNPFFLNQFLLSLYEESLIKFDAQCRRWRWDQQEINNRDITDNVVDLMTAKLHKLPKKTQKIIKLAACIGNRFNLHTLAAVYEASIQTTAGELWEALSEGLLMPLDDGYESPTDTDDKEPIIYRFLHDRVQQAAYAMIADKERAPLHLKIGQLLHSNASAEYHEEHIFDIVAQLNHGRDLIFELTDKEQLAQLNLEAGIKAKHSAAYDIALDYFCIGQSLLETDCWQQQYTLAFSLFVNGSECQYLIGDYHQAVADLEHYATCAQSELDQARIYKILSNVYSSKLDIEKTLETGLQGLKLCGVDINQDQQALENQLKDKNVQLQKHLEDYDIESLLELPINKNPVDLIALELCVDLLPPAYNSGNLALYTLLALTVVKTSLERGNNHVSSHGYTMYGVTKILNDKDYVTGFRYAHLGLQLSEKFDDHGIAGKNHFVFACFVSHWQQALARSFEHCHKCFQECLQGGDLTYAGYSLSTTLCYAFFEGKSLAKVDEEAHEALPFFEHTDPVPLISCLLWKQSALCLQGKTQDKLSLSDHSFNEEAEFATVKMLNNDTLIIHFLFVRMILNVIYNNYTEADALAAKIAPMKAAMAGLFQLPVFHFFESIIICARYADLSPQAQIQALITLRHNDEQHSIWGENSPGNFQAQSLLIKAEYARITGDSLCAMNYYDKANETAKIHNPGFYAAIISEVTASYYSGEGRVRFAEIHLIDAHYQYERWGAIVKVLALAKAHPNLRISSNSPPPSLGYTSVEHSQSESESDFTHALDLNTVIKASQAISSEIRFSQLLETLTQLVLENSGAQRSVLLLNNNGELCLEVEGRADQAATRISPPINAESQGENLPLAVIHYTEHSDQAVVLENASTHEQFNDDPYIRLNKSKSILCLPIHHQRQLLGILYLENTLTTGAFTPERCQLLQLLSGQAAIALENARLYSNLEDKVEERTRELKQRQAQLLNAAKMAGLGTMVAGASHELNNPNNFIQAGVASLTEKLADLDVFFENLLDGESHEVYTLFKEKLTPLTELLSLVSEGSGRVNRIVKGLRTFSQLGQADYTSTSIVENLESAIVLVQANFNGQVNIVCDFQIDPRIECWASELNQAFMNLLTNACQAIVSKQQKSQSERIEEVTVSTRIDLRTLDQQSLAISFDDSGCGMTPQVQAKMFEPFFTTRETGEGTGLGLAIVYGIIEKHHGDISVESSVKRGTKITLYLPLTSVLP